MMPSPLLVRHVAAALATLTVVAAVKLPLRLDVPVREDAAAAFRSPSLPSTSTQSELFTPSTMRSTSTTSPQEGSVSNEGSQLEAPGSSRSALHVSPKLDMPPNDPIPSPMPEPHPIYGFGPRPTPRRQRQTLRRLLAESDAATSASHGSVPPYPLDADLLVNLPLKDLKRGHSFVVKHKT